MPPFENDDTAGLFGCLSLTDDLTDDNDEHQNDIRRPVPLIGVQVNASVVDFIAEVTLSQCYHNTEDKPLEVTYHFPVDEAAAVCGFEAHYEDGSVVKGQVKEKNQAKQDFEHAKRQGKQVNLLKSVRRDIFSLNVGNLKAREHVKIIITYVTTLEAQEDAAAFVLPTSIAPRFTPPGTPVSNKEEMEALVPTSSTAKLFGLDIQVNVTCRSDIQSIASPTHPVEGNLTRTIKNKTGQITMKDITMDRDLIILVKEAKCHQPRVSLEVSEDDKMTGFVSLFPQIEFPDKPREFIFIIDRSGSMRGQKIQQARESLLLFLRALPSTCTFNILGFGSRFESLYETPQPYAEGSLEEASSYATALRANLGGTQLLDPLKAIFRHQPSNGTEQQLFVLTDGQVSNNTAVFDLIRENCSSKAKCRLFSVGIGGSASRLLVRGMANAGRGTSRFVQDGSANQLRVEVLGQLKQALQPALDDVSICWKLPDPEPSGMDTKPPAVKTLLGYRSPKIDGTPNTTMPKFYPSTHPPIFNREKYLSYAMFPPGSRTPQSVTVSCQTEDGPLEVTLPITSEETFEGSFARKLAARTAIAEYEDNCNKRGSSQEALELALANSLASEWTSFIAIRENPTLEAGTKCRQVMIPQQQTEDPTNDYALCRNRIAKKKKCASRGLARSRGHNPYRGAISSSNEGAGDGSVSLRGSSSQGAFHSVQRASLSAQKQPLVQQRMQCVEYDFYRDVGQAATPRNQGHPICKQEQKASSPSSDQILRLCLLQKADGSFEMNQELVSLAGLSSPEKFHCLVQTTSAFSIDPFITRTILALAAMRGLFTQQRSVWELQEGKVLKFLASRGHSEAEIATVVGEIQKINMDPTPLISLLLTDQPSPHSANRVDKEEPDFGF